MDMVSTIDSEVQKMNTSNSTFDLIKKDKFNKLKLMIEKYNKEYGRSVFSYFENLGIQVS